MRFTPIPLAVAALALSGCVSFGSEPPESLLTLTARDTAPASAGAAATGVLSVAEFEAPPAIDATRVPVQIDDSRIAYLKNATWVERPARLFRRLVAETVRAQTGRVVTDSDAPTLPADSYLSGTVRRFGYDARTSSVVVIFDAVRPGEGNAVETRRFEAIVPGVAADVSSVGPALNKAANDVAVQVADWVG